MSFEHRGRGKISDHVIEDTENDDNTDNTQAEDIAQDIRDNIFTYKLLFIASYYIYNFPRKIGDLKNGTYHCYVRPVKFLSP